MLTPKLVAMIEADPCVAVDAGGCHSAAISNTGHLYVFKKLISRPFICSYRKNK